MKEEEWLESTDPEKMLKFLRGKVSDRKLRLFACACCRRIWHVMEDDRSREAVEVAERFVDDNSTCGELDIAWRNSWVAQRTVKQFLPRSAAIAASAASTWYDDPEGVYQWLQEGVISGELFESAMQSARQHAKQVAAWNAAHSVLKPAALAEATQTENRNQAELLRDVIGNPFRPITFDPTWLASTIIDFATVAYQERTMPSGEMDPTWVSLVADALEDAACDNQHILGHLRSPGPHVRGCWAVDLVLGLR